jgi:MFS family permease
LAYISIRDRPEDLGLRPIGLKAVEVESGREKAGEIEWKKIYRVGSLWHLGAIYFMFGFSYIIYFNFFATYLVKEIGWTHGQAGALFTISGIFSIFCGLFWGYISDIIGRKGGGAIAYLTLAISYGIFALFDSAVAFYVSAIVFGLTVWSVPTIMAATAGDSVGPKLAPAGLGFITLFFGIGQAIGPAVGGVMADYRGSFTLSFLLATGVSLVGMVGFLTFKNPRKEGS